MRAVLFFAILIFASSAATAQDCPRSDRKGPLIDSAVRTLTGKVVFHNDLRRWPSLELPNRVCGERTVQLVRVDERKKATLDVFRGCTVTVTGKLGLPGTGYYSAEIYQEAFSVKPATDCKKQPAFPDFSKVIPDRAVRRYSVKLWFDYYGPQGGLHGAAISGSNRLKPWQAYVSYSFNGEEDLTAGCIKDFRCEIWRATPGARPSAMDNRVIVMPEWAAEKHVRRITISYLCKR